MERRTVVYRGAIREEAESAYHDDAVKAAADGFVPTSETWSAALGQQVLTVDYVFQPEQAPAVIAALHGRRNPAHQCKRTGHSAQRSTDSGRAGFSDQRTHGQ